MDGIGKVREMGMGSLAVGERRLVRGRLETRRDLGLGRRERRE